MVYGLWFLISVIRCKYRQIRDGGRKLRIVIRQKHAKTTNIVVGQFENLTQNPHDADNCFQPGLNTWTYPIGEVFRK